MTSEARQAPRTTCSPGIPVFGPEFDLRRPGAADRHRTRTQHAAALPDADLRDHHPRAHGRERRDRSRGCHSDRDREGEAIWDGHADRYTRPDASGCRRRLPHRRVDANTYAYPAASNLDDPDHRDAHTHARQRGHRSVGSGPGHGPGLAQWACHAHAAQRVDRDTRSLYRGHQYANRIQRWRRPGSGRGRRNTVGRRGNPHALPELRGHRDTDVVLVTATPKPVTEATAQVIDLDRRITILLKGTLTPTPANWVTPTPLPLLIPFDVLTATPTPALAWQTLPGVLDGKILFLSDRLSGDVGEPDVFVMNPDGSGVLLVTQLTPYQLSEARDAIASDAPRRLKTGMMPS